MKNSKNKRLDITTEEYAKDLSILLKTIKKLRKRVIHKCTGKFKGKTVSHNVAPISEVKKEIKKLTHNKPKAVIETALFEGEIYLYKNNMGLIELRK